jgi:hypothetical protein
MRMQEDFKGNKRMIIENKTMKIVEIVATNRVYSVEA